MSTTNQIFFEDKSDVPDLLKSLADYPFSFPVFDDTGKSMCFKMPFEALNLRGALVII